jgi:hypothetical protein
MSTIKCCITSTNVHAIEDVRNVFNERGLIAGTARLPDTVIHDARGPRTYQRNLWEFAQPTSVVHVQHDLMPGSVVTPISHEEYLALSAGATVAKVSWPDAKE